jgi:hypothetical protein
MVISEADKSGILNGETPDNNRCSRSKNIINTLLNL